MTPAAFAHFTHMLKTLAGGRICVCLEVGKKNIYREIYVQAKASYTGTKNSSKNREVGPGHKYIF